MPDENPLDGLTDLGLSAPSASNSVGEDAPDVTALLGNAVLDEAGKARVLEEELGKLQGSEGSSVLDRLLSPEVLISLLGGGAAAAFGGTTGQGIGAGLGLGALKRVNVLGELERSQKTVAIEDLQKRHEDALNRVDKARNRFSTLFNTNPEAFVSPEGEMPDARVLGWYITGTDIPLFPQTRRIENRRDTRWQKRFDVLNKALTESETPADARRLATAVFQHLDWKDVPAEVVDAVVGSFGTEGFDRQFASTLLRHGGPTALDAMIFAGEEGLPLHDPQVLRKVQFQTDGAQALIPSQQLNQRYLNLLDEVNRWQGNPTNAAQVLQIQQEASGNQEEATASIIDQALTGRNADIAFLRDKANLPGGKDLAQLLAAYSMISSKQSIVDMLQTFGNLEELTGMTPDELKAWRAQNAVQLIDQANKSSAETQGNRDAQLRNNAASSLQSELSGASVTAIYGLVDRIMSAALEDATRNEDGTINRASFESLFTAYTQKAIKDNTPEQE